MATTSTIPQSPAPVTSRTSALAWLAAVTILVSAFLLFQVQPVISKKILPWFGGSPAVWTTCVLFFQLVLLAGYAYSHWLIRGVRPGMQAVIHVSLLALALATLLIGPQDFWKPADGNYPALRILVLLAAVVGVSYFLLSTTGPLVQAWFSQLYPGRSPYRLYALSNIGSLAALLTYPFLIERMLYVDTQWWSWTMGFVVFGVLIGLMARAMWREAKDNAAGGGSAPQGKPQPAAAIVDGLVANPANAIQAQAVEAEVVDESPRLWLRLGWLVLAALASMGLLAITNHLCQDIAVVPFMWVIPLSLYLLTFIICFDSERWYVRKLFGPLAVLGIIWLTAVNNYAMTDRVLEYPQEVVAAFVRTPKLEADEAKQEYAKKTLRQKIADASPFVSSPFSQPMDKVFDGVDWSLEKADAALQWAFKPPFRIRRLNAEVYDFHDNVVAASAAYLSILFLICMVCHGELVKSKPQPAHLTSFYLSISAGGALGGLFVALICPQVFKSHFELNLTIIGGLIVGWVALFNDGRHGWLKNRELLQWVLVFFVVITALFVIKGNGSDVEMARLYPYLPASVQKTLVNWNVQIQPDPKLVAIERNFYGTVSVTRMGEEGDIDEGRALYNGRIWHGFQYVDPSRWLEPTTYYVHGTGAALALTEHPRKGQGLRIAVIGLGTGSMAAHAQEGDVIRFYDIDPKVVDVAHKYFHYLENNRAKETKVVLGDARISMERELRDGSQNYDVIVLDAFSGDAIPAHLLTAESFALYEQHLRKDENKQPSGVLAVHISNRYLDLKPVVAAIARKYGYKTLNVDKDEEDGPYDTGSEWVLVSKNEQFMNSPAITEVGVPLDIPPEKEILWTDQYTALFPILK